MPVRLRVHFAPVGYEADRVVRPIERLEADRAILICAARTGTAATYHDEVVRRLDDLEIGHHTIDCHFWDMGLVVDNVGGIMAAHPEHDFFYNASTGAKTCAMAGITAATFWDLRPYYQPVNYERRTKFELPDQEAILDPFWLPTFHVDPPDPDALHALRFLYSQPTDLPKKDLMEFLKEKGILGPKQKMTVKPQALHAQADAIIERLKVKDFLRPQGKGPTLRLKLTEKGRACSTMFHHVLDPRPRLPILS